jgi:hypothetical protein
VSAKDRYELVLRRAVEDPDFRDRLTADPASAIQEATGVSVPDDVEIVVLENTSKRFHLVLPPTDLDLASMDQSAARLEWGSPEWAEFYQLLPPRASWLLS